MSYVLREKERKIVIESHLLSFKKWDMTNNLFKVTKYNMEDGSLRSRIALWDVIETLTKR